LQLAVGGDDDGKLLARGKLLVRLDRLFLPLRVSLIERTTVSASS